MKVLAIIALLCSATLLVTGDEPTVKVPPEPPADITTTAAPTTTTPPPSTTTITTTTTPSSTTTKPTTTTTTTVKPTSTSTLTPTTTTTVKPTPPATVTPIPDSTSTLKPTEPPTPNTTPVPEPKTGKWVVNGTDGNVCIVLKMAVEFNITYMNLDNKTVSELITVPTDNGTTANGTCDKNEQVINIKWISKGPGSNDTVVLHFVKNETKYSLHHIETYISSQQLLNINQNKTVMLLHNISEYRTSLGNSYRCAKTQELAMTSNVTGVSASIKVSDLQFQAFKDDKTQSFGYAEDCTFETPDVVPIAVGCALIALVVIVLAAYLIGRRRNQARGYLSM